MANKGEAGFGDPFTGDCFDDFNIIQFMNDNNDLIESLADRSSSSKSSEKPQAYDDRHSRNTESVEGDPAWISPVSSSTGDEYPPTSISNNNNNNVYIINTPSTMAAAPTTILTQNNNNNILPQSLNNFPTIQYAQQPPSVRQLPPQTPQLQYPPFINTNQQHLNSQQSFTTPNLNAIGQRIVLTGNSGNMGPSPPKRKAPSDLLIQKPVIKTEPVFEELSFYGGNNISPNMALMESNENLQQRQIQFIPFVIDQWSSLYNVHQQPVNNLRLGIVADKGFNYSYVEGAFINQKKNHFQITVNVDYGDSSKPAYFLCNGMLKEIADFKLGLCGIKAEMPSTEIGLKQSNSERKPIPYEPASVTIGEESRTQIKVPRLHFSETTLNNQRKSGKPNPDQKFFLLCIKLFAYAHDGSFSIVQAYQSEKVIVRASNPAAFEPPEPEATWQPNKNVLYTGAPVAIGTEKQINNAQLSVMGNIVSTGTYTRPSDRRVKEDIVEIDTRNAIDRLAQMRIVEYSYKPEFAQEWGLDDDSRHRVGVIAQEVAEVIPDAVRDNGEFLTVDDTRIFYDTVAAAQELYRVTGSLECKIGQVERISAKLAKFAKNKGKFGSTISGLSGLSYFDKKDEDGKSVYSITSSSTATSSPRRRRQGYNDDMCSSRFTQYTVTLLIFIMAMCLLAMCSLYVLDWYRRVNTDPHGKLIPAFNYSDDAIGNLIEQKYGIPLSWLPESQPFAPILASKCGLKRHCSMYCCGMAAGPPSLGLGHGNASASTIIESQNNNLAYEVIPPEPFENNFSIEILNLGVNLDQRFCIENSCRPRRGRFNLYVPMSPFLPTVPLQLRFKIGNNNKFVDNCGSLRDFFHKKCNNSIAGIEEIDHPTSYTIHENTFELSVGDFIHSAYRFRIGYTTESCNMSEDQRGRSFDEVNIVFYRKCYSPPSL